MVCCGVVRHDEESSCDLNIGVFSGSEGVEGGGSDVEKI